jgi:hypothetical protein
MAWDDFAHRRFFAPLYPLAFLLCWPWLASLGAVGLFVVAYSLGMAVVGGALAAGGWWKAGDALALGVVGLDPAVLVLAAACAAAGALAFRFSPRRDRGPAPTGRPFADFWARAEWRPPTYPFAGALGLAALPFLALGLLAAA